jgi:hypothetical protein
VAKLAAAEIVIALPKAAICEKASISCILAQAVPSRPDDQS